MTKTTILPQLGDMPLASTIGHLYGVSENPQCWPMLVQSMLDLLAILGDLPEQSDDDGSCSECQAQLIRWLTPHLTRVVQQQAMQIEQQDVIEFQGMLLDQHHLAIGLCNTEGNILWANMHMREYLPSIPQALLGRMLAPDMPRPAIQSIASPQGTIPLVALNASVLGGDFVVLLASSARSIYLDPQLLKSLFGLTDAEANIAQRLAEGLGVNSIAEHNNTSLHTVRSQLKSVMSKIGASRQSELVTKLYNSPVTRALPAHAEPAKMECKQIRIDGRALAYAEYGPPRGRPVLFVSSWGASRLQAPPDPAALHESNIRLIAPDRPGIGLSEAHPAGDLASWARDVEKLADHLGIAQFGIVGYSLGSSFAIACAHVLKERVNRVVLVGPLSPLRGLADLSGMMPFGKAMMLGLAMRLPSLLPPVLHLWMTKMRRHPELYIDSIMPRIPPKDAECLKTGNIAQHYRNDFLEACRNGDAALQKEMRIMVSDWSGLLPIDHKTTLWHGEADGCAPIWHSERLLELMPNATLKRIPDSGHLVLYHHWRNILADICAPL